MTDMADSPLSIFSKIEDTYRPERESFDPAGYNDFVKEYDSFIHEFKWEEVRTACLQATENTANPFLLVSGDLSGIQDTVYTISSKGALKSLRARSFMLELLCEHCCYELLTGLLGNNTGYKQLRKHVVFSGGGRFCLLLPNKNFGKQIEDFKKIINEWAFREFSGRLYVAIAGVIASAEELKTPKDFADKWETLSAELEAEKHRKFSWKLETIFSDRCVQEPTLRTNEQECQICHRDDLALETDSPPMLLERLRILAEEDKLIRVLPPDEDITSNPELTIAHELCFQLFHLGDRLTKTGNDFLEIIRTRDHPNEENELGKNGFLTFPDFNNQNVYYCIGRSVQKEYILRVNAKPVDCPENNCSPFYYASYVRRVSELPEAAQEVETQLYRIAHGKELHDPTTVTASFSGLAAAACGADFIGCARMDVDNLGQIFSPQGWGNSEDFTIDNLAQLSRLLNLFFKVFLDKICFAEIDEITDLTDKKYAATV
ncbi:MAG: hypothetical protein ACE5G1_17615, partial [bacterium]